MQILEVSEFTGVRSAVFTFRRRGTPLSFLVVPMVHLAEPAFYAEVTERLRACDLVVAEGVGGSQVARELTRSYRWAAGSDRLGLVVQGIDWDSLGVPIVRPDPTGEQFDRHWRDEVPWHHRTFVRVLAPLVGLSRLAIDNRRDIASVLSLDDLPTPDEVELRASFEEVMRVLIDDRDRRLVAALEAIHREQADEPIRVGVAYGAEHVRAVTLGLHALGYRPGNGEWLTVFGWDADHHRSTGAPPRRPADLHAPSAEAAQMPPSTRTT